MSTEDEIEFWGVPVEEHAIQMSNGAMQVRSDDSDIERIYPLARWIPDHQRFGGKVFRRTVLVVGEWEEVPDAG